MNNVTLAEKMLTSIIPLAREMRGTLTFACCNYDKRIERARDIISASKIWAETRLLRPKDYKIGWGTRPLTPNVLEKAQSWISTSATAMKNLNAIKTNMAKCAEGSKVAPAEAATAAAKSPRTPQAAQAAPPPPTHTDAARAAALTATGSDSGSDSGSGSGSDALQRSASESGSQSGKSLSGSSQESITGVPDADVAALVASLAPDAGAAPPPALGAAAATTASGKDTSPYFHGKKSKSLRPTRVPPMKAALEPEHGVRDSFSLLERFKKKNKDRRRRALERQQLQPRAPAATTASGKDTSPYFHGKKSKSLRPERVPPTKAAAPPPAFLDPEAVADAVLGPEHGVRRGETALERLKKKNKSRRRRARERQQLPPRAPAPKRKAKEAPELLVEGERMAIVSRKPRVIDRKKVPRRGGGSKRHTIRRKKKRRKKRSKRRRKRRKKRSRKCRRRKKRTKRR